MKVRKVVQIGLLPIRCSQCNALLCQASTGSVLSIVCGRCSTHTVIEASREMPKGLENPQNISRLRK